MKLKYYLRGLGTGILVTVVIVGISAGKRQMTDEEVKARARELGMVESTVLSNMNNTPQPEESQPEENEPEESQPEETEPEESQPEESEPEESQPEENEPEESQPEETEPEESQPEETKPEESAPVAENSDGTEKETVTFTIKSGQSSVSVSKMLAEAGLVESATAYDQYLCANGYDKKIRVGTYQIPVDAKEEEIALIITGR